MAETSRIIRAIRKSGTKETALTIGDQRFTLTYWEALNLTKELFLAVWGAEFNEKARQR